MINTLTLNPALDEIIYLDSFRRNVTNRIAGKATTMGGKGTHVSMNLRVMGTTSRAFGFAFGRNGRRIIKMIEDSGVIPVFVYGSEGESRVNYLIVEEATKDSTLVCDKGPEPTEEHMIALLALMQESIRDGDLLALSGDTSNFADPFIYNRVLDALSDKRIRVFLDASGKSLGACVTRSPFLIKPNDDELSGLTGRAIATDADIIRAIADLDKHHIEVVAVTLGGRGALVRAWDRLYRVRPPEVRVYNTVGCGDCFVAGLLDGFEKGADFEETLIYATAASAAMAEEALSVNFDAARARALCPMVTIERI
ncbi:1-phosphofructokinase family hexose kinase [Bacillota bacterium Meth-B3]